jgi:hypothetical protein
MAIIVEIGRQGVQSVEIVGSDRDQDTSLVLWPIVRAELDVRLRRFGQPKVEQFEGLAPSESPRADDGG